VRYPILEGTAKYVGRDSSVGIATHYGLDDPGIESQLGRGGEIFGTCPNQPWESPSLLCYVYRVSCPWVKQLGGDTEKPPPSSAEVKE